MRVFRIFPFTGDRYSFVQRTGFSDDVAFALADGLEVSGLDFSSVRVGNRTKGNPDLLGTGSSEFFVSERFKALLDDRVSRQCINFIRGELNGSRYYLLNIIGLRDAMDLRASQYDAFERTGEPDAIHRLVLKPGAVDEVDIFRLQQDPLHVFISHGLRRFMEEAGLEGIRYFGGEDLTRHEE